MVLLNYVIEVLHPPQLTIRRQNVLFNAGSEGFRVRGMLVRANRQWQSSMVSSHHLLEEAFCGGNVAFCAKQKFNCIALLIHSAIKIFTSLPDLDIGLIHSIGRTTHLQMWTDTLVDFWGVPLYPTKHG
jgi:hypothetical protein